MPASQLDGFPETLTTWIGQQLEGGESAKREVVRHIMSVYAVPLRACLDRYRRADDNLDIVHGFLIERVTDDGYLEGWRDREDFRLSHWLRNGLIFYARNHDRRRRRHAPLPDEQALEQEVFDDDFLDREFACSVFRRARSIVKEELAGSDKWMRWKVFERHVDQCESYSALAEELVMSPNQLKKMAEHAKRRFRTAVRELLKADGVPPERVDLVIDEFRRSI